MGCSTNECPTSLITPDSLWLFDAFMSAQSAHRFSGASLYGTNSGRWPQFWQDTVDVLSQAQNEADAIVNGLT